MEITYTPEDIRNGAISFNNYHHLYNNHHINRMELRELKEFLEFVEHARMKRLKIGYDGKPIVLGEKKEGD